MLRNLGLKLKVFFFMAIILAALSFMDFMLFKNFLNRIDLQQGPQNSAKLVEEVVKNTMYSLISNSFYIAHDLSFTRASRNAPINVSDIKSPESYAIINDKGEFVSGDLTIMDNFSGIPAVERALKSGIASDGAVELDDMYYVLGVVPVFKDVPGEGRKLFAVVSARRLTRAFDADMFTAPVRVFLGEKFVSETKTDKWRKMEQSCGSDTVEETIARLIKQPGSKTLNRWTHLHSFSLPFEMFENKVTIVSMTSYLPHWEEYRKVVLFSILYTLGAIIILLFFTFIVTHEIVRVFRKLAADVSKLRVGEKLVLKKYSHGADITVAALNTLISKYQIEEERDGISSGIESPPINGGVNMPHISAKRITREISTDIPDPFGTGDVEDDTPKKPIKALEPEVPEKKEVSSHAPPPSQHDEDDEKTQIAANNVAPEISVSDQKSQPEPTSQDIFDQLWEDYCKIKEAHGEKVTEKEKKAFIGKIRTNRASIMAKYRCSDVSFNIEEKDGKPVIKAKPLK